MTGLSQNVEDLLKKLETNSKSELNLIRALAEAIRQVDDQTLRELRNLSLHHELRRETIVGELQVLAQRMCHLPVRAAPAKAAIERQAFSKKDAVTDVADEIAEALNGNALNATGHTGPNGLGGPNGNGADWRQAARNIQDDLDLAFGSEVPRH